MTQENRIGQYPFIALSRMPDIPKENLAISARAGVSGVAVWKTGCRGNPFPVRAVVDCSDLAAGQVMYSAYCKLIGEGPQDVIWADETFSPGGISFLVMNVQLVSLHEVLAATGGLLDTDGGARLEVEFTLLPVDPPGEE
jgi:hypothetical protein